MSRGPVTRYLKRRNVGFPQIRVAPSEPYIGVITPILTAANSVGALSSVKSTVTNNWYDFKSGFPKNLDGKIKTEVGWAIEFGIQEMTSGLLALANGLSPFVAVSAVIEADKSFTAAGTTTGSLSVPASPNNLGVIAQTWVVVFSGAAAGTIFGLNIGKVHEFTALDAAMEPINPVNSQKYFTIPAGFFSGTWAVGESFTFSTAPASAGTTAYANPAVGAIGIGRYDDLPFLRIEADEQFPDGSSIFYVMPRAQITGNFDRSFADAGEAPVTVSASALAADDSVEGGNAVWNNADNNNTVGRLGRIYCTEA